MAGKDKVEKLAGRNVVIPADGGAHYWEDTKEVVTADTRKFLEEIAASDNGLNFKGEQVQNPDLLFYSYEVQPTGEGKFEPNPIRGILVDLFQRPESFNTSNDDEDVAAGNDKIRAACFIMLTRPCYVKGRSKKVRLANIGEMVWVDLNQSTSVLLRSAPRRNDKGVLVGLAEVAIDPQHKEPFQGMDKNGKPETRQAWRTKCYGGFDSGPGFKKYIGAEEITKKLGAHIATPSIVTESEIARVLGIARPGSIDAPQLNASN